MHLRIYQIFVEIIRQNGFSAAAKALNATQSTISKSLVQLESHYEARLINRGRGHLQLTFAGEYVYRHAMRIIAEEEAIAQEITELKGLKRGTLKIGLPPIGSSELFAPVLARFTAAYPHIDIQIVEHGSKKLEELVLLGEIEIAASLVPVGNGLEYQNVRKEPVVALMATPPTHNPSQATLKQLVNYPFVLFDSQFALTPIILDVFKAHKMEPTISARSSQIDFIFGLVAAGMGVGFLPRMIAQDRHFPGVHIVEIKDALIEWHMALVWRKFDHLSYAARQWLKISASFHKQNDS